MFEKRKLIYRAGLIPYYVTDSGEISMLFMRPSNTEYGEFIYQIAKGRVDDTDEDHRAAAIREAKEELGLFIGNTAFVEEIGVFMGRTTVFIAKINDPDMFGEPDFETESVKWMTLPEFLAEGRLLHQPVVEACHRRMVAIERGE